MSRIVVAGVVIGGTALGSGVAVKLGVLNFLEPGEETRVTITHVDLASFTVQTQGYGRRGRTPVKVILRLPGLRKAQEVCRAAPSLRKAILRDLYRNPIPLGRDGTLEPGKTTLRLLKVTNGMMGSDLVSDVIVIDKSVKAKPGSPEFANLLSCRKLLALPGAKGERRRR